MSLLNNDVSKSDKHLPQMTVLKVQQDPYYLAYFILLQNNTFKHMVKLASGKWFQKSVCGLLLGLNGVPYY